MPLSCLSAAPLLGALLLALPRASADTVELAMRDGVKLHTEFDLPLFYNGTKRAAVLERSPYGANAEELIGEHAWPARTGLGPENLQPPHPFARLPTALASHSCS